VLAARADARVPDGRRFDTRAGLVDRGLGVDRFTLGPESFRFRFAGLVQRGLRAGGLPAFRWLQWRPAFSVALAAGAQRRFSRQARSIPQPRRTAGPAAEGGFGLSVYSRAAPATPRGR